MNEYYTNLISHINNSENETSELLMNEVISFAEKYTENVRLSNDTDDFQNLVFGNVGNIQEASLLWFLQTRKIYGFDKLIDDYTGLEESGLLYLLSYILLGWMKKFNKDCTDYQDEVTKYPSSALATVKWRDCEYANLYFITKKGNPLIFLSNEKSPLTRIYNKLRNDRIYLSETFYMRLPDRKRMRFLFEKSHIKTESQKERYIEIIGLLHLLIFHTMPDDTENWLCGSDRIYPIPNEILIWMLYVVQYAGVLEGLYIDKPICLYNNADIAALKSSIRARINVRTGNDITKKNLIYSDMKKVNEAIDKIKESIRSSIIISDSIEK